MRNMKILINYANKEYRKAQKLNTWTGKHIAGFDKVYSFAPEDIDSKYYEKHKDILNEKRGNGLWLWKPYFIDKVLNECNDGDIVFYSDSGSFFLKKIQYIVNSMRFGEKIWVSDNPLLESCFTKDKCFEKLGCVDDKYKNSNQIQATYMMFVCSEKAKVFVKQWLRYCEDYEIMSPQGDLIVNENRGNSFVVHREDQSVLSLLCKKQGVKAHRDPSQRGKVPETFYSSRYVYCPSEHKDDKYGTIIFLHKDKNPNIYTCIKVLYRTIRCKFRYMKKIDKFR